MKPLKLKSLIERFKLNKDVTHIKMLSTRCFIDITKILQFPSYKDVYNKAKVESFKVVKDCLVIVVYK